MLALLAAAACGDGATPARPATGPDARGEVRAEVAPDAATGGAWTDSAAGLTWETHPSTDSFDWPGAVAHCEALVLAGHDDWRLPTIDELRLLVRGCPDTVAGGPCPETNACTTADPTCCNEDCMGCPWKGPGIDGCFWPPEMRGACGWYWSATRSDDPATYACFVHFGTAHLSHEDRSRPEGHHALCVR